MIRKILIFTTALFMNGCWFNGAVKSQSEITDTVGGYRTEGSAHAILGSYGIILRKGKNQYQRVGVPKWENISIHQSASFDITSENMKKLEELGVTIPKIGGVNISGNSSRNEKYKLIFLEILDLALLRKGIKEDMKNDDDLLFDLKNPDARLIISSGTIFNHDLARTLTTSASANAVLSNVAGSPEIKIKGGTEDNTTIKIGDKTVVAYQFARFCWDDNGILRAIVRDQKGLDASACPKGTDNKHPDFR